MTTEGEAEVTIAEVPDVEAEAPAVEEQPVASETEAQPEAAAAPAKMLDALLAGELPDDVAFYAEQSAEAEPDFTAADLEALGTRGKMLLAALLARTKKAAGAVETFATEQDAKVSEARTALQRAQEERARALEWTKGEQVQRTRDAVSRVLADRTPLDPNDPNYMQRAIDRAVAQRMGEFFGAIDNDAQQREAAVTQAKLDAGYEQYRQSYETFYTQHRDALVVPGQKETITRWTSDANGERVQRQFVVDKRTPLAVRMEEVQARYGPDPVDPRKYRMTWEQAYTLALHELSQEGDASEYEESMKRARERVVRPAARQAPPLKPPVDDPQAFAEFLANNPGWVADQNKRHFGG